MPTKTNKKNNIITLTIVFSIVFNMFLQLPKFSFGQSKEDDKVVDLYMKVLSDKGEILKGSKNIDYDLSYINLIFNDSSFKLASPSKLNDIKIIQNGKLNQSSNYENYKFEVDSVSGAITLTLKDGPPKETHMEPFRLIPHTLYNIYIPAGTLKNSQGKTNKAIYHTFVTKGEGEIYNNDILIKTSPYNKETGIDYENGLIELEFVDEISLVSNFQRNIGNYLEVITEPMDPAIPTYNMPPSYQYEENINNFNVYASGNKLVLKHKDGKLKDFAKYTIRLKDESLFLKNSNFANSPHSKIFNIAKENVFEKNKSYYEEITFYTDNMLKRTYPRNNQENVEVEPTIEFEFKYPVEILNKNEVTISSDGMEFALDKEDIYLSTKPGTNNTVLQLNINDQEIKKIFPLRRHTVYKVTIGENAVQFKDYWDTINKKAISNKEINLYFITRGAGEFPVPNAYSSNINKSDDIRYLNHNDKEINMPEDKVTNLATNGSIYIHFDRNIREDKQIEKLSLLGATKLYKLPKAYTTKYDSTGNIYDEEVIYDIHHFKNEEIDKVKKVFPRDKRLDTEIMNSIKLEIIKNNNIYDIDKFKVLEDLSRLDEEEEPLFMEEVLVGKVEIISGNILKVTPKYELEALNKYGLWIDKRVIEDINRFNMEHNLKLTFWTKADNKNTVASWLKPSETKAESIYENTQAPYKTYTLFGVPQYGPEAPIVLDLDKEVIPKAQDDILEQTPNDTRNTRRISYDALMNIDLIDVYPTEVIIEEAKEQRKEEYKVEAKEKAKQEAINKQRQEAIDKGEEFYEIDFDNEKFEKEFEEKFDIEFEKLWTNEFLEEELANLKQDIEINKLKFLYYFENGVKKTKIYLYPNKWLTKGKQYRLTVPYDTLETRSGKKVETLEVNFVVEGKWEDGKGVYSAEGNQVKVIDVWSKGEHMFKLFGHNFHEEIERVELRPMEGRVVGKESIFIEREDIEFRNVTELWVKIRGENARRLSTEEYTGSYEIALYFNNSDGTLSTDNLNKVDTELRFNLISKGHPTVIKKEPEGNADEWYNEHNLKLAINPKTINGVKRYFLKVTFEDIDGKLEFSNLGISSLLNAFNVIKDPNSTTDYLDTDFLQQVSSNTKMIEEHIFNKDRAKREAYLYIPIKLLNPQATYNVNIPETVVANDSTEMYNRPINWTFTTKAVPSVTDSGIIIQSVIEDYDANEPLIIYGDLFYEHTVQVYFNDIRADRVKLITSQDGKKYLEVYLPRGRNRLNTGLYNIIIQNSKDHKTTTYGTLSVVPMGEYVPEDGKRIKESNRYEEVEEIVARSEDTIYLNRYSRNSNINLDLDDLTGEYTLVRKVEFSDGDSIRELSTNSKWANIDVYNIRTLGSRRDESYLYLGRTEAFLANSLKRNLQNYNIKSDIIQVIGENVNFERLYMEIPYENGVVDNYKVLRYDETSRAWTEENFNIDYVDKRVTVTSYNPGMFVVVESKY